MPVRFSTLCSLSSEGTIGGSEQSRASILVGGKYDDVQPLSSGLSGRDVTENNGQTQYSVAQRPTSRHRQDRVNCGWMDFVAAFDKFDKVHNGLLPKYTARLDDSRNGPPREDGMSPRTAAENDLLSQQVLRVELQAMNDAWREMLLAYEQLAIIERESWTDESLCLDILPYIKSFTQFLEWEYKLIRGWSLPSRYRGQHIMDAPPKPYEAQVREERYPHTRRGDDGNRHQQEKEVESRYADDPASGRYEEDVKANQGDQEQVHISVVEEEDGESPNNVGDQRVDWAKMTTQELTSKFLTPRGPHKGEQNLLKATLVQTIVTRAPEGTNDSLLASQATHHGLSLTRGAIAQSVRGRF